MKKSINKLPTGMAFIIPIFLLIVSFTASAQSLEGRSNSHQLLLSSVTAPPVSVSKESLPDGAGKPVNISDKTKVPTAPKPLGKCLGAALAGVVGGCSGLSCSGNSCDVCQRITLTNQGCNITSITVTCSDPNICFSVCWGGTDPGCPNVSFQKTSGVCDDNAKGLDQGSGFNALNCITYIDICYHQVGGVRETWTFTTNASPTCCNDAINDTVFF
jgi:hypothetical protein